MCFNAFILANLFSYFLSPDMIAALGETTGAPALPRLREQMLGSVEGRRILRERPRINSETVDMERLSRLPQGTFGRAYMSWLDRCGVTPDSREPVSFLSIFLQTNSILTLFLGALYR